MCGSVEAAIGLGPECGAAFPQRICERARMSRCSTKRTMRCMNTGYAVSWNGVDGTRCAGRLDVGDGSARLVGASRGVRRDETITFDDIASVRLERGRLHIDRRVGAALLIGSLDGPGTLREVAERLAASLT